MTRNGAIVLGTRGSTLALRQTELALNLLSHHHPSVEFEVRTIQTPGDRNQRDRISEIGDKGVFVRPIERALLDDEIDIAVHSLKDVPSEIDVEGAFVEQVARLTLAAFLPRADARDVVVSRLSVPFAALPPGSRIGTGSARRRVQLAQLNPSAVFLPIRGNVDTRLRKLDEGEYDAIVLAAAGLDRLGLGGRISEYLDVELCVPDAGQGIIALQTRAGDGVMPIVQAVDDPSSRAAAEAERETVRALHADCHSPVGVYAIVGETLDVAGMAATEDGSLVARAVVRGWARDDPRGAGRALASELAAGLGVHIGSLY
jgi:hydroxymethylbilane synthase